MTDGIWFSNHDHYYQFAPKVIMKDQELLQQIHDIVQIKMVEIYSKPK